MWQVNKDNNFYDTCAARPVYYIALDMKSFTEWQIYPLISKGTIDLGPMDLNMFQIKRTTKIN